MKANKKYYATTLIIFIFTACLLIIYQNNHKDAPKPVAKNGYYVAMGDSVAAGVGLPTYSDSSACDRTRESYPNIIADELKYNLKDVACSGATTDEGLISGQKVNDLRLDPQLAVLSSERKPDLITVTIGANDAKWTSYIQKCYTSVCGTPEDTAAVTSAIDQVSLNLDNMLTDISKKYPKATPRVILTGYYKLFAIEPTADCSELSGIDANERQWIAGLQDGINNAIRAQSDKYAFASYADINFDNHELCSADSWIQGLGGKAPFHPTEAGQKAIADAIIKAKSKR